jgi:dTDP-4-amino-4,6-dideoxygalactose transaminase
VYPESSNAVIIPFVDLAAQQREIDAEVRAGLDAVFASTQFIGGPQVAAFERDYANAIGVAHCVGVANGTDAIELALRAVGVRRGGEVILPANTFIATAEAVERIGARTVLVDVDPQHLLMDPKAVEAVIGPNTQAVVPVHLFGQVAPVEHLLPIATAVGAAIVEDAAQAQGATRHGRPAGGLGSVGGTSFYPGKNLGAAGDAGAVTTDDPEIAERVRVLGAHGSRVKYVHEVVGVNSRLDTVQAVVLSAKLKRLTAWNAQRRTAAARYSSMLADVDHVEVPRTLDGNEDVWHLYVVRAPERDRILESLHAAGIGAGVHYPTPLHRTRAMQHLGYQQGAFPVAENAAAEILSLPIYPGITVHQQSRVVEVLAAALMGTS